MVSYSFPVRRQRLEASFLLWMTPDILVKGSFYTHPRSFHASRLISMASSPAGICFVLLFFPARLPVKGSWGTKITALVGDILALG